MTTLLRENDSALLHKNIEIACRFDTIGRLHFRSSPLTPRSASRFAKIQLAVLKGQLVAPSPTLQAALSLVLFDGVANEADLLAALTGLEQLYRWDGNACLDWTDPVGRQNRRHLSVMSQIFFSLPRGAIEDAEATLQALDSFLGDVVRAPSRPYSLELLLLDAQAWLYERLPPPLFSHCIGKAPITALSRSALARHESGFGLASTISQEAEEPRIQAFANAIGSYFGDHRRNQSGWFIDELVTICRRKRSLSNSKDKQRMLQECAELASRSHDIAPMAGLILGWVIDLLQSGTRTKTHLKAITPAKYVSSAAKLLWQAFRDKQIEDIGPAEFQKLYLAMMVGLSTSQMRTLASALSSWHFFLGCWFDVPPIYRSFHRWVPASPPKANIVWSAEIETIRTWLTEPMQDVRHQEQLRVAFAIASQIRIRASELLNLRMQNIHWDEASVTIEIATKAIDGGVKTLAAFRRDKVQSGESAAIIQTWYQRRQREGAFPCDYLFGDPRRPENKYAPGQLYADLNRLIKAVTGDSTIALHALSHTRISMDWRNAAFERLSADINPFEREAVDAGHASAATGFANYFHLFEGWLRSCLDHEIEKYFASWSCISPWVGKSPDAYRQARCRARKQDSTLSEVEFAVRVIEASRPTLLMPSACDGIALNKAINPMTAKPPDPLGLCATLDILNDIAFGHSAEAIALRSNRSSDEIDMLGRTALNVLRDIGEIDRHHTATPDNQAILELHACLQSRTHQRMQFQRAEQAKVGYLYDLIASGRKAAIVTRGIEAWEQCYRRGYLSFEDAGTALPFIVMLDAADFPRSSIVIRGVETLKRPLMASFRTGKPGLPHWESIQPRPGRPKAFLALASYSPSKGDNQSVGNAAIGMGGVHALIFATAVLRRMSPQAFDFNS